ncbi:alpha/beta hydrolase [Aestuariivivens sediminicola]|uniref:alpha/beta hydrolase n=1 Tax=Aestuariivivens sediminicola TaxID=2913560 RepID=UPI001F5A3B79|nr:alpha/beta hydrolase-fold protein [Aestuariivivens sediminicola]
MKNFRFFYTLMAALLVFWNCEVDPLESNSQDLSASKHDTEAVHKSKLQNKVFISEALTHNALGNTNVRKLQIYTPPGYDKHGDRMYPVVYLLHGEPFSEKTFIDMKTWDETINPNGYFKEYPDFPEQGFKAWVDDLIDSGAMEPMIIVMPNSDSEAGYRFSFYSNSILNGNFEDYIVTDVVRYMDEHYNTITNASGRAVIGYSQGGYAAFKYGLKHADIFGTVASHSGLLLVDAVLSLGEVVIAENPDGFTGPDPTKFLTSAGYAMSAAWSPNLENPPFFVDLPFEWPYPEPLPEVAARWYEHDVFTLLDTHVNAFKSLKGIYFDVGIYDELGIQEAYPYIIAKLDYYGIDYTYKTFKGGHFNKTFERLAESLTFCSNAMH